MNYTWSYSSIELFKQCPHKYYRLRVVKDIPQEEAAHLTYGTHVHEACEHYIRSGVPLPPEHAHFQPYLDRLNRIAGNKYCEFEMGLTQDMQACAFKAPDVWWRGIADLIIVRDDEAFIVDYKTSKNAKFADTKQLELLSLGVFKHFPQVKKIRGGLLFLCSKDFIQASFEIGSSGVYWMKWLESVAQLEDAIKRGHWTKRPNFTCKKFCPIVDCDFNGR